MRLGLHLPAREPGKCTQPGAQEIEEHTGAGEPKIFVIASYLTRLWKCLAEKQEE